MSEMTVREAVECIRQNIHYYEDCDNNCAIIDVDELIIALLTQQQAEIEGLKKNANRVQCKSRYCANNDNEYCKLTREQLQGSCLK